MCKLSDDFSDFVDTCGTGKHNRAGALVLGNGRIGIDHLHISHITCPRKSYPQNTVLYVTQHKQMRRMSAKVILNYVNRCATRSKFVKFLTLASDDIWHMFFKIHTLVVWKYDQKKLFTCYVVCLPDWLALQNETYNWLKHGLLIFEILTYQFSFDHIFGMDVV